MRQKEVKIVVFNRDDCVPQQIYGNVFGTVLVVTIEGSAPGICQVEDRLLLSILNAQDSPVVYVRIMDYYL